MSLRSNNRLRSKQTFQTRNFGNKYFAHVFKMTQENANSFPGSEGDKQEDDLQLGDGQGVTEKPCDTDDVYDRIGSIRVDPGSVRSPATAEDAGSIRSSVRDDENDEPYSRWDTLPRTSKKPTEAQRRGLQNCNTKRILIAGTFTLILLLAGGLLTVTVVLFKERSQRMLSMLHATTTPASSTGITVSSSMSTTLTSQLASTSPSNVTSPSVTTNASASPSSTTDQTTSITSSTSTTSTSTSTPTSAEPPCSGTRKCHSCNSRSNRCPRDGGHMNETEKYGMVEDCACSVACFSEVRKRDENVVHRGCVTGQGSVWEQYSKQLNCQNLSTGYVCFCLGIKCNNHNMTGFINTG